MTDKPNPYPKAVDRFPKLRQSRLATFDQCALLSRFDEEYRKDWSGHPQGRGQIFHRFAAKALAQMAELGEGTIDPEDALAILRECLRQHDVPDEEVVNIPFSQVKDLRWVVVKWAHDNVFDIQYLADIEQRLDAEITYEHPDIGQVPRTITGALDALFIPEPDWAVVIDWKDSWSLPPATDLSGSGYFQQRFYAYLVMRRYESIQRVTLREHYVRYSESREATVFRTDMANIEEELSALVERWDRTWELGKWPLEDGEAPYLFTPSPGAHCAFCPRPASCPIFPAARVDGAITDEETAERWAAEQIVAKAAVNQRDKALKAWAGARGPIPVRHAKDPNRVLGYRESTRTKRPTKEQLETALAQQGADIRVEDLYEVQTTARFDQHSRVDSADMPDDADLMNALDESLNRKRT
jgi:hypothetical protein